jgi:LDH2 family malate/lactate/ureidoglycolate dehydrogenase
MSGARNGSCIASPSRERSLSDPSVLVTANQVRHLITGVLGGLGVLADAADAAATVLVEADLAGVDSHGCHLLPMYVRRLEADQIKRDAPITVERDEGATLWLDAHLGLGQLAGLRAAAEASSRAGEHGVAAVAVREATHLGALGSYTRRIAEAGCIGLCFQNGPTIVPPYGGITPLFSTNPISYAVPTESEPTIVYDIATTAVAGNKLLLAKKRGDASIPEGWANDAKGRPTTDTDAASVWNLQWFGAHKGYGLGLLVEIMAGLLAGSSFGRTEHTESAVHGRERVAKGFTIIAIDPGAFLGEPEFRRRTDELIADVRSSEKAEGIDRVWLPGEMEYYRRIDREREGIPLPTSIVEELDALADAYGAPRLT